MNFIANMARNRYSLAKTITRSFSLGEPYSKRFFMLRYTLNFQKLLSEPEFIRKIDEEFITRVEDYENKRIILYGGRIKESDEEEFVYLFESENETEAYDFIKDVG